MGLSATIIYGETCPDWARYAVNLCRRGEVDPDVWQVFSSKRAAERFARAISFYFPLRTGDDLTMWALVYAMPEDWSGHGRIAFVGLCYASYDPCGVLLKYHVIPAGYCGAGHKAPAEWCGSRV